MAMNLSHNESSALQAASLVQSATDPQLAEALTSQLKEAQCMIRGIQQFR